MSFPALRQPKSTNNLQNTSKLDFLNVQYMILTLRDKKKLVVSSDAYNGVIIAGDVYKCVFCGIQMELDPVCKENHLVSQLHKTSMESFSHIEEFGEHLIRKLKGDCFYCTICNVMVSAWYVPRHILSEVHGQELEKAMARVAAYKPFG